MSQQLEVTIPYEPHSRQVPFHNDRYRYKYRLLRGGTGSGKTIAGTWEMLDYLLENSGAVGYIFEPNYKMVTKILIPNSLEMLLGFPIESNPIVSDYRKTEHRIDLCKGSRLWFGGLEDPEMAEGPNIDFIMVDEGRLVRKFEEAWRVIQRRIRGSVPGKYPVGAYVTTTPDAPGSFMHTFFENPKTKDPDSQIYNMTLYDNPHLTEDYKRSIERGHHGGLAERFIFGRFAAVGVGTIPFDASIHVKQLGPKEYREVCYGVDFGFTNPSCILSVAFDGDGVAYVLDEFYQRQIPHNKLVVEATELQDQYGKGTFYCDRSEPETIELFNSHGLRSEGSSARRDESIRELAGRFAHGPNVAQRIYIDSQCVNLIAELQIYDERVKENDHAVDALRYVLASKMKKRGDPSAWRLGPTAFQPNISGRFG